MLRAHFTAQSKSSERDWDALLTLRRARDAFPAKSKLPTKAHAKLKVWSAIRQNYLVDSIYFLAEQLHRKVGRMRRRLCFVRAPEVLFVVRVLEGRGLGTLEGMLQAPSPTFFLTLCPAPPWISAPLSSSNPHTILVLGTVLVCYDCQFVSVQASKFDNWSVAVILQKTDILRQ